MSRHHEELSPVLDATAPSAAQQAIGALIPESADLTGQVLFGLAFRAGWPEAMSALTVAQQVLAA